MCPHWPSRNFHPTTNHTHPGSVTTPSHRGGKGVSETIGIRMCWMYMLQRKRPQNQCEINKKFNLISVKFQLASKCFEKRPFFELCSTSLKFILRLKCFGSSPSLQLLRKFVLNIRLPSFQFYGPKILMCKKYTRSDK